MSADDYLYVRKTPKGAWTLTVEFVSSDDCSEIAPDAVCYLTWAEAYKAAQEREREEPYGFEYGIYSDPAEF